MTSPPGIRDALTTRINAVTHPSRLINQVALADWRCGASAKALTGLIGRSPKILKTIRTELQKAFGLDPNTLLFTEREPLKIDNLTDRTLLLLVQPAVAININQFTTLSVKGDPAARLSYTPREALQRVIALGLFERLNRAFTDYWSALGLGSWLTRREHWVELHQQLFADRAFIARQLDELSAAGLRLAQAVVDAPTVEARQRAGGDWACVHVSQLMWPGTPAVALPGAVHVYREDGALQVIYLPGLVRQFYEFPSFEALQCGLLALERSLFDELWQCLPLNRRNKLCRPSDLSLANGFVRGPKVSGDALALGAEALLDGQWGNELACAVMVNHAHVYSTRQPRPQPLDARRFLAYVERARQQLVGRARLGAIGVHLLEWDHQRRRAEVTFASTAPGQALRTAERQVKRYEKGLAALLAKDDASAQTPAYREVVALERQLKAHAQGLDALMQGAGERLLTLAFWAERPGGAGTARRVTLFVQAQLEALRCEVQVQHRLKLMSKAQHDLVIDALIQPPGGQVQVLAIEVGSEPDAFYLLHNLWVITTAAAQTGPARQLPVVLYAFGMRGGVQVFEGVDALTRSVKASLDSRDDSVLWGCVERDKRPDLRGHAARGTLAMRYVPVPGQPARVSLKKLLGGYHRLHKSSELITRIFSEVKDAEMSRSLLLGELEAQLKVPLNEALSQALSNVGLLRDVMADALKRPARASSLTPAQRRSAARAHRLYLSSALAFESRLEQQLPDLERFARRTLRARLNQDGFTQSLDIDQPLIDLPDDVQGRVCGWESGCPVGDHDIILTPSATRTGFSLLQLALHNLDPLAPWTQWRFDHGRYLQPEWQARLGADYLIKLVSSLDIGGQYEALIDQAFYPSAATRGRPDSGRIAELLNRSLQTAIEHHLLEATQRGLTANAQSVFSTAMAARTAQDLLKNQHELQLCVVHLVGHTLQHDRYIAGVVVVHDNAGGRCVVYWPEAPQALVLTEYASLQQASDELNRIGAVAQNTRALARQVAPGWAFEAIDHQPEHVDAPGTPFHDLGSLVAWVMHKGIRHGAEFVRSFSVKHLEPTPLLDEIEAQILEQIASDPKDWLALVPTSHSDAKALLFHASVLDLHRRTQAASRSGKALADYRTRRLDEQSDARTRRVVGFFLPLWGMANDAYELLLVARRFHRFGDAHDALDVGFMSVMLAVDLLLTFIPGHRGGKPATRVARPALGAALRRLHRLRMAPGSRMSALPAARILERFKVKGVPEGAVALKGPGQTGIYVKNGEAFVADDTHHYPIYQRENEQLLRLKNPQSPGQDELILNIHEPRDRLLTADAPQPTAGTSSGRLIPWRAPGPSLGDWQPPIARPATEREILQSVAPDNQWLSWRTTPVLDEPLSSPATDVFRSSRGTPHNVLRVAPPEASLTDPASYYYRLLPEGDRAPLDRIMFIHKDELLSPMASVDVRRWTNADLADQPLPVSRNSEGEWIIHKRLFDKPLEDYVGQAFPTMTANSRAMAINRLIELADSSHSVTATHLLNVRATLDNWLAHGAVGQTDDLLRMLTGVQWRGRSFHTGFGGHALFFDRLDFDAPGLNPALRTGGASVVLERATAQREAVKNVLGQQGFIVQELRIRRYKYASYELIATHPASDSNRLYYITLYWLENASIRLNTKLTDYWFETAILQNSALPAMAGVLSAMKERRLVRLVAGIQWPVREPYPPTVYFVKVIPIGS